MFTAKHVVVFENERGAQKLNISHKLLLNLLHLIVKQLISNYCFNSTVEIDRDDKKSAINTINTMLPVKKNLEDMKNTPLVTLFYGIYL